MDIFYILLYNIIIILKYFYYFYYSIIQLFLFFSLKKPIHYYNSKFESIYFIHLLSGIFLLERHNNKNLPLLQSPTCNIILFNVTFSAMCYYSYNYTSSIRNNQQTRIFFRGQILKRLILFNITYLNYYFASMKINLNKLRYNIYR